MTHTIEQDTPYARVKAEWEVVRGMVELRYGDRVKRSQASSDHGTNEFVARDLLRSLIAEDLAND